MKLVEVEAVEKHLIKFSSNTGWWRIEDEGLNDGDPISTFTDKSGNSRNLTASSGARPTYESSSGMPNNHHYAIFDGSDDTVTNASYNAGTFLDADGYVLAMVVNVQAAPTSSSTPYSNDTIWSDTSGWTGLHLKGGSDFQFQSYHWDVAPGSGIEQALSGQKSFNTWYLCIMRYDGTNLETWVNNDSAVQEPANNQSTLSGQFRIGTYSVRYGEFKLAEFATFDSGLTTGDINDLKTYFNDRYSLW